MRFILLTILLTILIPTTSTTETTNNLVSTDFATGWTNTGNSNHGSTTIAGVHNGTVESDSVSLANDVGLNQNEINEGFTVNSSGSIWFWNNYDQSVTMTTKAVDNDGQIITQNRTVSGTCATWNGCTFNTMSDTMIFNSNTQTDYDLSLGFSFSVTDPLYQSAHYAADLKDPSMTVTYTPISIDSAVESELLDVLYELSEDLYIEDLKEDNIDTIKTVEMKEETLTISEEPELDTMMLSEEKDMFDEPMLTEDMKEEETLEEKDMEMVSDLMEEEKEENELSDEVVENDEKIEQDNTTNETESTEKTNDDKSESDEKIETADAKNTIMKKTLDKIDEKVKEVDKNLQLKHLVKINAMVDNSVLLSYNVEFYIDKKIYQDQVNITDDRIIYTKNLDVYSNNDPIFLKTREVENIRLQKQKLLNEIEVLKNG